MPFGLHSALATFQRAQDSVIGPDMEPHAFAYLDDIIVIGATPEDLMENLCITEENCARLGTVRILSPPSYKRDLYPVSIRCSDQWQTY